MKGYCSTHHEYDFCWQCEYDAAIAREEADDVRMDG